MYKRLIFLISFALVLGLAGNVSAAVDANIPKAGNISPAIQIDGIKEDAWLPAEGHPMPYVINGSAPESPADCSGSWYALWDSDYLYVFIDVNDYDLWNDLPLSSESYHDDSVEIYIDIGNNKLVEMGPDDYQYRVAWNTGELEEKWHSLRTPSSKTDVNLAILTKGVGEGTGGRGLGYTLEIQFPWSTLDVCDTGLTTLGDLMGFMAAINDDDAGGDRDTQIAWLDGTASAWQNPSLFGTVMIAPGLNKAYNPDPYDGETGVLSGLLKWTAGLSADSHDVYFGTDETPDADEFKVNQAGTQYSATIGPDKTYYWQIDEVNDPCVWVGDVWGFTTAGLTAHSPDPPDDAKWIACDANLVWCAGFYANKHNIYFGTVDPPPPKQMNWSATNYDPGTLEPGKTYYWAIDEVNTGGTPIWEGATWSFTTLSVTAGLMGEYYSNQLLIGQPTLKRTDYSINFDWGLESPATGIIPENSFSVRWTAELQVPYTETYTFITNCDKRDGVRLWLKGVLIIDNWAATNTLPIENTGNIALTAGMVPIVMEYRDTALNAMAKLSWQSPSIPREIIPRDRYFLPMRSISPDPANGEEGLSSTPILSWSPGMFTDKHDIYFGTNETAVADANRTSQLGVMVRQNLPAVRPRTSYDIAEDPNVGVLQLNTTYYWRIDDFNSTTPGYWKGNVWNFTTDGYHEVEIFESYANTTALKKVWHVSGSDVNASTDTLFKQTHGGSQAMAYTYTNGVAPFYSEAYANASGPNSLDFGKNWRLQDVKALSLWFLGALDVKGSFKGLDPYTIEADGLGLKGAPYNKDYFYYVYRYVAGKSTGQVEARVDSLDATNTSAMAGVMIRQSTAQNSKYAALYVTADNKVVFQQRRNNGITYATTILGITLPRWLRLGWNSTPPPSGTWVVQHAPDNGGVAGTYTTIDATPPFTAYQLTFGINIYLGLCVTSSSYGNMCTAEISNVALQCPIGTAKADPDVGEDIGWAYNDPEKMFVVLKDSDGNNATVYYPGTTNPAAADANATLVHDWTEWRIDMKDFIDAGVDVCDVNKMYIGFGNRSVPAAGGSGIMFFDDIGLYLPGFYAPECPWPADLVHDGVIDYSDLGLITDNWLISNYNVTPRDPDNGPVSMYRLEQNAQDAIGGRHGTAVGSPTYTTDNMEGDYAINLDGINDEVSTTYNAADYGIDGNKPRTVMAWAYTRDFSGNIAGIYEMGESDYGKDFSLRVTAEPNVWRAQHWGEEQGYDIDFTYPSLKEWVHFAHVYDGTKVRIYADGYFIPAAERTINLNTGNTKSFHIGRYSEPGGTYYFDGIIDDVRIYDYALTQDEVAAVAGHPIGVTFAQPLELLMIPTNPNINVYVEDPNITNNKIDFRDIAELGNVWGETMSWPTW